MQRFRKPNVFTLFIVVMALFFAFRLVGVASAVVRESDEEPPPLTEADIGKSVKGTVAALEDGAPGEGPASIRPPVAGSMPPAVNRSYSAAELEVLQSLSERRDELDVRERALVEREALLAAAEQEVDRKIAELNTLKKDMEQLLGQQAEEEEARIHSLVKIYENMKPKEAARIFDTLEMDILLDVIGRMNERKASPILASMSPETARQVTIKLAEQRRLPGKNGHSAAAAP